MKTSQVFAVSAVVISITFFGVLSIFEFLMDWVISDIILGIILYLGYLGMVMVGGSSRTRQYDSTKKVTA